MYSKKEKKNKTEAHLVSNILSDILPARELIEKSKAADFFDLWHLIVDDSLLENTTPHSLHKGTLTIEVADAVFAQEISLRQSEIKFKLAELGYGGSVSKIRCITTNPKSVKKHGTFNS